MEVKITLFEYDSVGETGKTLQLIPGSIEKDVMVTVYEHGHELCNIVVNIDLLLRALRKIKE